MNSFSRLEKEAEEKDEEDSTMAPDHLMQSYCI